MTILTTDRLVLAAPRLSDYEDSVLMWTDSEVVRFIGGVVCSREEVWARLLRHAGHWSLLGYGYWVVRDRASGRFVGEVGLADFHRDLEPGLGDGPEAGWALAPWAQGRGLATEALKRVLQFADQQMGVRRTSCLIATDNHASVQLATKCGYDRFATALYRSKPVDLYERCL